MPAIYLFDPLLPLDARRDPLLCGPTIHCFVVVLRMMVVCSMMGKVGVVAGYTGDNPLGECTVDVRNIT